MALVAGIGNYSRAAKLANPVPDARAMEDVLRRHGFEVVIETDRTKHRLDCAVDDFVDEFQGADLALVYFAGHGLQIQGRNFLLPTDAMGRSADELQSCSLLLDVLLTKVAAVAPRRIILLDACRNDPFGSPAALDDRAVQADGIVPGLGRIGRADGTIYAFATAPGTTAADGDGRHSPFADALLRHFGKPGLEFGAVMKLVQMDVYERTRGQQIPYVEDALPGLFFADVHNSDLPERDRLLLAMAEIDQDVRSQVERIAGIKNVPLAPLYGALLAAEAISAERGYATREARITQAAENFLQVHAELKALASSDPDVARLRAQADEDILVGSFDAARNALTQAIELDLQAATRIEARLKERDLSRIATLAARAGVARARLDYRSAAADFAAAAEAAEPWDTRLAWSHIIAHADNLKEHGYAFGQIEVIQAAISGYRRAETLAPKTVCLEDWLVTQNRIGSAQLSLGERASDNSIFKTAFVTLSAALDGDVRTKAPQQWAKIQNSLGWAFTKMGQRETGDRWFELAIEAFRNSQAVFSADAFPLLWSTAHSNIGSVLTMTGELEKDFEKSKNATVYFREALVHQSREEHPLTWAMTQNQLGAALSSIGLATGDPLVLRDAAEAFRQALLVRTRERVPLAWALATGNLAELLANLGERECQIETLYEAISLHRASLEEYRRERVALDWARTQLNLGLALHILGTLEKSTARLEEAVNAFRLALLEYTTEQTPSVWGMIQCALGRALGELGEQQGDTELIREAIACPRRVLKKLSWKRAQYIWTDAQYTLGVALTRLAKRENGTESLSNAIAAFRSALRKIDRGRNPLEWMFATLWLTEAELILLQRTSSRGRKSKLNSLLRRVSEALEIGAATNHKPGMGFADRLIKEIRAELAIEGFAG